MIKSMTGYGSSTYQDESYRIFIEVKSVNHRYCEINFKINKEFMKFEIPMRKLIKQMLIRGKVDVNVVIEKVDGNINNIDIDDRLLSMYIKNLSQSIKLHNLDNSILQSSNLYQFSDIISVSASGYDVENLEASVLGALKEALINLDNARIFEGKVLIEDISVKLDKISKIVNLIELDEESYTDKYKQKMFDNFSDLIRKNLISEERLAIEAGILLDKICIDEELTRLKSHLRQAMNIITNCEDEVGRKFDFLLQEFNRESNTILSKSVDTKIINYGIELKSLIEKIREQVQNLV